jgi:iron(III) transport system ATP-binding protein
MTSTVTRRALIRLEEVVYQYASAAPNESSALGPISLEAFAQEFLVVLGPSGSGKTTLLRLIAGLEMPQSGRIELAGCDVTNVRRFPPEQRGVGMVFQDYALFPHLTVEENIAFGLAGRNGAKQLLVQELLELVGLAGLGERYPHELSGGEQQRVALARTLAPRPKVILLDEPFSNLDADLRREMRSEVRAILRQLESTVILVTHDQEEAFDLGDRIAVLQQGRLEQLGTPEEIYTAPATRFVAEFIGRADFLAGRRCSLGIQTELGVFPLESCVEHETWDVLIRPDMVEIEPDPQGEARIVAQRFAGLQKLYCLELPSGQRLHSLQPSTRIFKEGSRVRLRISLQDMICFPQGS